MQTPPHQSPWLMARGCCLCVTGVTPGAQKRKKPKARRGASKPKTSRPAKPPIEYISLPKHWFSKPLLQAMATTVRPPTKSTRRKKLIIKLEMPKEIFFDLLKPLDAEDVDGLVWKDEARKELEPTEDFKTYHQYKYTIKKPSVVAKLWRLEESDKEPKRLINKKMGQAVPFRRGLGSAKLHLSHAAGDRGERTDLISQVVGNVSIILKEPKEERAMPTGSITFAAASMDKRGHINWPTLFAPRTAAALRKQIRFHLEKMIDDPTYPTLTQFTPSLTLTSETVLLLKE